MYPGKYRLKDLNYFDQIKQISWEEILKKLGFTAKKTSSNQLKMKCIFHSEKTASLNFNPKTAFFYCFGCGATGNKYQFVLQKLKDRNKTIKFFRRHFNITPAKYRRIN